MVDVERLKDKIIEKNMTMEGVADDLGKDRSTVYRHFKAACENMKLGEIRALSLVLGLSKEEILEIFLS